MQYCLMRIRCAVWFWRKCDSSLCVLMQVCDYIVFVFWWTIVICGTQYCDVFCYEVAQCCSLVSPPSLGLKYVLLGLCFITQKTLCKSSTLWHCYVGVWRVIVNQESIQIRHRQKKNCRHLIVSIRVGAKFSFRAAMVTPRRWGFDSWRGLAVFAFTFRLVLRLARPPG